MTRPVVETTSGRVCGCVAQGAFAFRGVPYAAAPVGEARFALTRRAGRWTDVRDAGSPGRRAPQLPGDPPFEELFGSPLPTGEDCLTLEIWTPDLSSSGLPVLVWLHSGGFVTGAGSDPCYPGASFARDGVVFVGVNYRLGCLGWLCLDELFGGAEGTGNLGLWDQLAALEWVQENIASFGGDPARVTLGGVSAGGGSTAALLATPAASGLFRRAIVQSGARIDAVTSPTATSVARRFLTLAGVAEGDWAALRALPVSRLLEVQRLLAVEAAGVRERELLDAPGGLALVFGPVLDGVTLSEPPVDAAAARLTHPVDLLIGTTADEWRLFCGLGATPSDASCEAAIGKALEAEPELSVLGAAYGPRWLALSAVETERTFRLPAARLAAAHAQRGVAVYAYRFCWSSTYPGAPLGACHGLDIPFVFDDLEGTLGRALAPGGPPALAASVHAAWTSFVSTGQPAAPSGVVWRPHPASMLIDEPWLPVSEVGEAVVTGPAAPTA